MAATIPQPMIRAKYATVYDVPVTIAKVSGVLYVIYEGGQIETFEVEMAPFTVVLGDVTVSETRAMWDRVSGGVAFIATHRAQEIA